MRVSLIPHTNITKYEYIHTYLYSNIFMGLIINNNNNNNKYNLRMNITIIKEGS